MKRLTIIGGGPAALMLAAQIDTKKYQVVLYERKVAVGRKFLVAGEGGLNLTYNSSEEELISKYSPSEFMQPVISKFTNKDFINWLNTIGVPTFIGSSNRVYSDSKLKPIEVLNKVVEYISKKNISIELNKKWLGWNSKGNLRFEDQEEIGSDIVVYALGGASWKVTGSDGKWAENFKNRGVQVQQFRAANCAFGVRWRSNFIATYEGKPLKNIALRFENLNSKGELVITKFGLEGNAIYVLSQKIQDELLSKQTATVYLDLKPTLTIEQLKAKFKASRRRKVSDILKEDLNLNRTCVAVLKQFSDKNTFIDSNLLVETIKSIPIVITSADDLDKAISTLGGIALDEIDENFQFKKIPNSYAIGEMLDWYAPTGGYLLQACFSMGFVLAKHLNEVK